MHRTAATKEERLLPGRQTLDELVGQSGLTRLVPVEITPNVSQREVRRRISHLAREGKGACPLAAGKAGLLPGANDLDALDASVLTPED